MAVPSAPPSNGSADLGVAIKVAGALSGSVFVSSLDGSVAELRTEVARLLGGGDAASIKLIAAGKTLQDSQTLRAAGISATSRILITRGAAAGAAIADETERQARLQRLRRAVESLAGRNGHGRDDAEGYELALENQAGGSLRFKPEDQKAIVMGLTMHERGKDTMASGVVPAALDELLLAEECFTLCDPSLLAGIDNIGMLLLDIVWCAYKLGDIRRLAVCRERLCRAREALTRAYGPNLERARRLHGGDLCPELATFARLEAMEGVVAYHSGDRAAAAAALAAARQKLERLRVDDGAMAQLASMGYGAREARRALRFASNDVIAAAQFVLQQRDAAEQRTARRRRTAAWSRERARYGRTATGSYVEVEPLDALCGMGYELPLAAEALRQTDNNASLALEALLDPSRRAALGLAAALTSVQAAKDAKRAAGGSGQGTGDAGAGAGPSSGAASATEQQAAALARGLAESWSQAMKASGGGAEGVEGGDGMDEDDEDEAGAGPSNGQAEAGDGKKRGSKKRRGKTAAEDGVEVTEADKAVVDALLQQRERDAELEEEILAGVKRGQDPMDAYDIDVEEEAEVVRVFLALLESQQDATVRSS